MYYEEKWINDQLHYRNVPNGTWMLMKSNLLCHKIKSLEKQLSESVIKIDQLEKELAETQKELSHTIQNLDI